MSWIKKHNTTMKQKTVMCFGDSNTWGYVPLIGTRYDRETRWPGVLQRELGAEYYVIEEGLPGRTTVWDDPIEGGKNGFEHLVPLIHSHSPLDLLIIMLGTNDLKNRFGVSAMDVSWSIGRLVKAARDSSCPLSGKAPEVLVICPPPFADMSRSPCRDILIGGEEKSHQLATVLRQYCQQNNIRMVDAGEFIQSSPVDGIHLEPGEHRKLGKAIADEVRRIL